MPDIGWGHRIRGRSSPIHCIHEITITERGTLRLAQCRRVALAIHHRDTDNLGEGRVGGRPSTRFTRGLRLAQSHSGVHFESDIGRPPMKAATVSPTAGSSGWGSYPISPAAVQGAVRCAFPLTARQRLMNLTHPELPGRHAAACAV